MKKQGDERRFAAGLRYMRYKGVLFRALGFLLLLAFWSYAAERTSGLVIASVGDTLQALAGLFCDRSFFFSHFGISLGRVVAALLLAVSAGATLGILAGLIPEIRYMLEPLRWMLMTVPGVVVVMVFMLWFGMGGRMVVAIAATMAAPVIYIHVVDAMQLVDRSLLEMTEVYALSFPKRLFCVYGMAVAGPFCSALVVAVGNIIRMVVLAEVLGADGGIGYCLAMARSTLDTPLLYALALTCMLIAGVLEFSLFRPLAARLNRGTG